MSKYRLDYTTREALQSHLKGIGILLAHKLAGCFVPFRFNGSGIKRPPSPHTNFDECGIQVTPATDADSDALPNAWDFEFQDPDNDAEFKPPRVSFDTMFASQQRLESLQGIPLNELTASRGSPNAFFAFHELNHILHSMADEGVYATDAKLANFIMVMPSEEDCREWPPEFGLTTERAVKCIDGGQFVAFNGNTMVGDGVCSLFLEMRDHDYVRRRIEDDAVGQVLMEQARTTTRRKGGAVYITVDLDILIECCLLCMATQLGVPFETRKDISSRRVADIVIGN